MGEQPDQPVLQIDMYLDRSQDRAQPLTQLLISTDLDDDLEGFETATRRASESLSMVSSVHTTNLTDFSSENEDDISGYSAISEQMLQQPVEELVERFQ